MKIFYYVGVLPSPTQFEEIGAVYPGFAIIVATDPRNPKLNRNQAQILYCRMFIMVTDEQDRNTWDTF
jgi:hypothetical protein